MFFVTLSLGPSAEPSDSSRSGRRRNGGRILDLTESNPTRAGLIYPPEMLQHSTTSARLLYEPAPAGLTDARQAVADYYGARGLNIAPDASCLLASTSEAYAYLFKLLADPGDNVLVPARPIRSLNSWRTWNPSRSSSTRSRSMAAGRSMCVRSKRRYRAHASHRGGHPNNPTGSFLKRAELDALAQLCAARRIALIPMKCFRIMRSRRMRSAFFSVAGCEECLAFAMSGLSKIAGLPQMKLGWIAVSGPADLGAKAMERLEWIADTYLPSARRFNGPRRSCWPRARRCSARFGSEPR